MSWYSAQPVSGGARILVNYPTVPPDQTDSDLIAHDQWAWPTDDMTTSASDPWSLSGAGRVTVYPFQARTEPTLVQTHPVTKVAEQARAAYLADVLSRVSLALWRVGWWGRAAEAQPCLSAFEETIDAVLHASGRVPTTLREATDYYELTSEGDEVGPTHGSWGEAATLLGEACADLVRYAAPLHPTVRISVAEDLRAELAAIRSADRADLSGRAAQPLRPALTMDPTALPAIGGSMRQPMPVVPAELIAAAAWTSPGEAYRLRCSYRVLRSLVDAHGLPPGQRPEEDDLGHSRLSVCWRDWQATGIPEADRLDLTFSAPDGDACTRWRLHLETLIEGWEPGPTVTLTLPADASDEQVAAVWQSLHDPQFPVRCYYDRDPGQVAAHGLTLDERRSW